MLLILKLQSFLGFFFVGDGTKDFPNASSSVYVSVTTFIYFKINGVLTLDMPPGGVGILTYRRQIPCVSTWVWDSGDVVDSCFTHKFLYYYRILLKTWNMSLHTKLNNSHMYFRDIPIDYDHL